MSKTHTVINGQSLLDIAIRYSGTMESVGELANFNNISITDELQPGQIIKIPTSFEHGNKEVADYFERKNLQPATTTMGSGVGDDNIPLLIP